MNASFRLAHVTNFLPREIVDGGTNREEALARFLAGRGATRIVVQDQTFSNDRRAKLTRLGRLMKQIREVRPDTVVLSYPGYPFFWQHKVTRYFVTSLIFARWLRAWASGSGSRIIIDVTDLPIYQYRDLGLPMEMSARLFRQFDKTVFSQADELWVCSHNLAELVKEKCGLSRQVIKAVVNGGTARELPRAARGHRPFRFVNCGGLMPQRGTAGLISAFLDARISDAELHLVGAGGEWIPERFSHPQMICHGSRTNKVAEGLAARCDVGVVYAPQQGYYHLAFATKLAHYVCCGIPVLCTDARETARAVRTLGVGEVVDIRHFAEGMREMARCPDLQARFGNALTSAKRELSWEYLYACALDETDPDCYGVKIVQGGHP